MALDWDLITTQDDAETALAWSPTLNRFVAFGNTIQYSDDGINWVAGIASGFDFATDFPAGVSFDTGVLWNPNLTSFFAVSRNFATNTIVIRSSDGITWTLAATLTAIGGEVAIGFEPVTGRMVIVGLNGFCFRSDDGNSWTNAGADLVSLGATNDWRGVKWQSQEGYFVAICPVGDIHIATSPDGELWTGRHGFESAYNFSWNNLAISPDGICVATAELGGLGMSMRSVDGAVWETPFEFDSGGSGAVTISSLIWSELLNSFMCTFYRGADSLHTVIALSEDGTAWTFDDGIIPPATSTIDGLPRYQFYYLVEAPEISRFLIGTQQVVDQSIVTALADSADISVTGSGGIEVGGADADIVLIENANIQIIPPEGETILAEITGGFELGGAESLIVLSVDSSGIYTFIANQRFDRIYTRNDDPDDTTDVKIPDPFIKTAYFGS